MRDPKLPELLGYCLYKLHPRMLNLAVVIHVYIDDCVTV